ncbi:MAG TPA: hypothetical protein VKR29_04300, partial [Candidatus Binataceae bacterium]|nr:hypothetical protein [Candidatus Binataceae bacterium]
MNSFNEKEYGHAASLEFLQTIRRAGDPVIVPNLVIVEVASAVARANRDPDAGLQYAAVVAALPHISFLSLSS